ECQHVIILIDLVAGDLPAQDFGKNIVWIISHDYPSRPLRHKYPTNLGLMAHEDKEIPARKATETERKKEINQLRAMVIFLLRRRRGFLSGQSPRILEKILCISRKFSIWV